MSSNSRVFYAFLGGFVAGAVVGVLYAPDSGKNTREKLRVKLKELMQQLKGKLNTELPEGVNGKPETTLSPQDYQRAEELLHEVENLLDEIKSNKS